MRTWEPNNQENNLTVLIDMKKLVLTWRQEGCQSQCQKFSLVWLCYTVQNVHYPTLNKRWLEITAIIIIKKPWIHLKAFGAKNLSLFDTCNFVRRTSELSR